MKTLIWSVAWGDYRYMTQALMRSIKDCGVEHDILTFSDEPLTGVFSCKLDEKIELDFKQYWKFHYLKKVSELNYDLFVFIDSDHYFVRKPSKDFSEIIGQDPWHSFLESPINSSITRRPDWWGVLNPLMVNLYRDFGVTQETVYSTNGGFWMCRREFASHVANVGFLFRDFQKSRGLDLPEEVAISVISHMFSKDYRDRFHSKYHDMWASEWTGALKDKVPDGSPWVFQEYMTNEKTSVNPAIVHAMRSKQALTSKGKEIFDSSDRSFISWEEAKSNLNRN
jgi:hypothetical protein